MKSFPLYVKIALLAFQEVFEYRMNLIWQIVGYTMEIAVFYLLWRTILGEGSISSYTVSTIGVYYVLITLVTNFARTSFHEIADDIWQGWLTIFLVKPQKYLATIFAKTVPEKIIVGGVAIVLVLGLQIAGIHVSIPFSTILFGVVTLLLAACISFFVSAAIGSLAFWFQRVHGFEGLFFTAGGIFSGMFIPLGLLPQTFQHISFFLPFRWMISFPVQAFLGNLQSTEYIVGLGMQCFWIVVFAGLTKLIRIKGLLQYEATGR